MPCPTNHILCILILFLNLSRVKNILNEWTSDFWKLSCSMHPHSAACQWTSALQAADPHSKLKGVEELETRLLMHIHFKCLIPVFFFAIYLKKAKKKQHWHVFFSVWKDIMWANSLWLFDRVDQERWEVPSGQSAQQHQTHLDSIFKVIFNVQHTWLPPYLRRKITVLIII